MGSYYLTAAALMALLVALAVLAGCDVPTPPPCSPVVVIGSPHFDCTREPRTS